MSCHLIKLTTFFKNLNKKILCQHLAAAGNFLRDVQITIGSYILSGRQHAIKPAISLACISLQTLLVND